MGSFGERDVGVPAVIVTGALSVRSAAVADSQLVVEAVENENFGMVVVQAAHQWMRRREFAECATEGNLLGR